MMCPTFARPPAYLHLLEEVVESFRLQTYAGPKELIILNDCPTQQLSCDLAGVRVVNLSERMPTLGQKYNEMVRLAKYDLLAPAEDDDISLPDRLAQAEERIGDAHAWNPQRSYFLDGDTLITTHKHGVCHNASIFSREAHRAVGGYPSLSGAQDAVMDVRLRGLGLMPPALGTIPAEWTYIYCWRRSPVHLSGYSAPDRAYVAHARTPVKAGRYEIVPRWHRKYLSMTGR